MASDSRQRALLGVLLAILAAMTAYALWPRTPAASSTQASNLRRGAPNAAPQPAAPDVHLGALTGAKPKPDEVDRDLFKFKPKAPPPAPPRPVESARPPAASPPRPQAPAGPPPIPLKFEGYIKLPNGKKAAALRDERGVLPPVTEGSTVLGQYKIWRIGEESIDISYLDGRGRTTIRMTGQ